MRQFQRRFCLQISLCGKFAKGTTLASACRIWSLLLFLFSFFEKGVVWQWCGVLSDSFAPLTVFNSPRFMPVGWFVAKFRCCWESVWWSQIDHKQNLSFSAANAAAGIDPGQATAAVVYQRSVQGISLDISIVFTSELITKILAQT